MGTSCSSLKQSGYFKSGYYNIKEEEAKKVVFCNMSTDTQSDEMVFDEEFANLRDAIESNTEFILHNEDNLSILSSTVTSNTIQFTDQIQLVSTTLTESINEVSSSLTENINEVSATLTENINAVSSDVLQLRNEVTTNLTVFRDEVDVSMAPIGTIIAWTMKVDVNGTEANDIPAGWQRCDNSTILAPSIWAGQRTPDLNNGKRFLRGGSDLDVLTMEEDMMQDHHHNVDDPGHQHESPFEQDSSINQGAGSHMWAASDNSFPNPQTQTSKTGISVTGVTDGYRFGTETRPRNMNVIYIIRIY